MLELLLFYQKDFGFEVDVKMDDSLSQENLEDFAGFDNENDDADMIQNSNNENDAENDGDNQDELEKKRSPWWKYFDEISDDDGSFAKCKFCIV